MKTRILALVTALLGAQLIAGNQPAIDEVLKLNQNGVGEETIVAFIDAQAVTYDLEANDILALKKAGLPEGVILSMLHKMRTPSTEPATTSEAPVAIQHEATLQQNLPPAPPAPSPGSPAVALAAPSDPDVAQFYQDLSPHGKWMYVDSQWYWQPNVVMINADWRPYGDAGHWVNSDCGWYWSSDYAWGWAPFHYGRWNMHPIHGWMWRPDRVWGPAWVTWRSYDDYCSWAPLPWGVTVGIGGGLWFNGVSVGVGFGFGLGWNHYNYCYLNDMGLRYRRNVYGADRHRIFDHGTSFHRYEMVRDSHNREVFVNHGVDPSRVRPNGKPIERVRIEDRASAGGRHTESYNAKSQTLEVHRPQFDRSPSLSGGKASERPGTSPSRAGGTPTRSSNESGISPSQGHGLQATPGSTSPSMNRNSPTRTATENRQGTSAAPARQSSQPGVRSSAPADTTPSRTYSAPTSPSSNVPSRQTPTYKPQPSTTTGTAPNRSSTAPSSSYSSPARPTYSAPSRQAPSYSAQPSAPPARSGPDRSYSSPAPSNPQQSAPRYAAPSRQGSSFSSPSASPSRSYSQPSGGASSHGGTQLGGSRSSGRP